MLHHLRDFSFLECSLQFGGTESTFYYYYYYYYYYFSRVSFWVGSQAVSRVYVASPSEWVTAPIIF
jgi:hypothetical protein